MKIIITKKEDFASAAADILEGQISKKSDSVLGLATGSTPLGLYAELIERNDSDKIDFSKVITFNLDEYEGLPKDHSQSYYHYMMNNLFNKININLENVYLPDGQADNAEEECLDYENKIAEVGGIDLQILGIGHNGHIGFNEPDTPFESVTSLIDLAPSTIEANSRFFESADDVPKKALSMGIKTIMQAKSIVLLISGKDKADIALKALKGPITTDVPASVLQLHPFVTIILDEDAASLL